MSTDDALQLQTKQEKDVNGASSFNSNSPDEIKNIHLPVRTGSNMGAFFNIVCAVAGAGVLGLPYATMQGGWLSLGFILMAAFMSHTTGVQTIQCLYYKDKDNKEKLSQKTMDLNRLDAIPKISEAAFGPIGYNVTLFFNFAIMLGFTCIDLILAGLNMHSTALYFGFEKLDLKIWILIGGCVVLIPYLVFKTLKEVAIISLFGAVSTIVVVIIAITIGLIDLSNHQDTVTHPVVIQGIPLALSTISLAFGASVVFPHVEASMKQPKDFSKVLALSMSFVGFFYLFISIVGYRVYGKDVGSPILDSLPRGIPWLISTILITLHVILAAPIYLCSFSIEVEKILKVNNDRFKSKTAEVFTRTLLRIFVMVCLVVVSMFIPFFNDFMSLVGSLANGIVIFIIPVFCHLKLFGYKNRRYYEYLWLTLIVFIGLVCCILGSVESIRALVKDFRK